MTKSEKPTETAPAVDPMVELLGRFSAFTQTMTAALAENTRAIEALSSKVGEISVGAPKAPQVDPPALTREQMEGILRRRPSASFRLLRDVTTPTFHRARGGIIRPQAELDVTMWRQLLAAQVQLVDADENP